MKTLLLSCITLVFTIVPAQTNSLANPAGIDGFQFVAAKAKEKAKKADLETVLKKLDANNDNKLSKEEFAKIAARKGKKAAADPAKAAKKAKKAGKKGNTDAEFTKLDTDKDSFLSLDEFKKFEAPAKKKKKNS